MGAFYVNGDGQNVAASAAGNQITVGLDNITQYSVQVGGATNDLTQIANGTTGQILTANSSANPSWEDPAPTFTWNSTSAAGPTTMVVQNGYITTNAGSLVELDLPATASVGDMMEVVGIAAGGWQVNCDTGQTIHFGLLSSTTGTGTIASTEDRDCVRLLCITANTDWQVISSIGNITVT